MASIDAAVNVSAAAILLVSDVVSPSPVRIVAASLPTAPRTSALLDAAAVADLIAFPVPGSMASTFSA